MYIVVATYRNALDLADRKAIKYKKYTKIFRELSIAEKYLQKIAGHKNIFSVELTNERTGERRKWLI